MPPMNDRESLEQQADRAAGAGDFATARTLLEQAAAGEGVSAALWAKLSAMRKASGETQGALKALDAALAIDPLDFSILLCRALMLERLGDPRAAIEYGNALAQAPANEPVPPPMQKAIEHARAMWSAHQAAEEARLSAAIPAGLSIFERTQVERFISNQTRRTRHFHQEPSDFHFPGLPEIEFHDRSSFPELDALEQQTDAIRAEFEALIAAEAAEMVPYIQYPERVPLRQWAELNHNRDWTAIHLLQTARGSKPMPATAPRRWPPLRRCLSRRWRPLRPMPCSRCSLPARGSRRTPASPTRAWCAICR